MLFFSLSLFLSFVESVSVTTPSLLPSLSALLLLVPLVAAAVGVLLWRQKHISDRGESSRVFFFWQLSVFRPSSARLLPLSDVGRDILWGCCNESPPPLPSPCVCVTVLLNYLFVLRYWAVSVCPFGWSREHLWESWGYQTGDEFKHLNILW